MEKNNIIIKEFEKPKLTKIQLFNNKMITIFQKIDLLDVVASGIDTKWFTDLNLLQLKIFYKVLEDIWNYRAELTNEHKNKIVPDKQMFVNSVKKIYSLHSKTKLQDIILNEIDNLVSSANNNNDRITGSYFVLTALVEVSQDCANELPWLVQ